MDHLNCRVVELWICGSCLVDPVVWSMWSLGCGVLVVDPGLWILGCGALVMDPGLWSLDCGAWVVKP